MPDPEEIAPIMNTAAPDAAFRLRAANAQVRRECGWHVVPIITETLIVDGSGGHELLIPSGRIRTVISVTSDGEDVTADVDASEAGILRLPYCWTDKFGGVVIELEHGWAEWEAADLAGVVAAIASRSATPGGLVAAQGIAGASVRYDVAPMLESERAIVQRYAVRSG